MPFRIVLEVPALDRMAKAEACADTELRDGLRKLESQLGRLSLIVATAVGKLNQLLEGQKQMADQFATELEALRAEIERNNAVDASAVVLIQGLAAKLDAALSTGNIELVRALASQLRNSTDGLAAAVSANTSAQVPQTDPSSKPVTEGELVSS